MFVGEHNDAEREKYANAHNREKCSLFTRACAELIGGVGEGLSDECAQVATDDGKSAEDGEHCCRACIECFRRRPPRLVLLRARRSAKMVTKCGSKEDSPQRHGKPVVDNFVDNGVPIGIDTEFDVALPFVERADMCFEG
jgi:hypothetical protein